LAAAAADADRSILNCTLQGLTLIYNHKGIRLCRDFGGQAPARGNLATDFTDFFTTKPPKARKKIVNNQSSICSVETLSLRSNPAVLLSQFLLMDCFGLRPRNDKTVSFLQSIINHQLKLPLLLCEVSSPLWGLWATKAGSFATQHEPAGGEVARFNFV
jgi:hypothetical protein